MEQLYKGSSPCLDDHQFRQDELESVGELSQVCSQIAVTCLYLSRTDKLSTVTKWTQACDRRLARLISFNHHINNFRKYCHVGRIAQHCRFGLFEDSDFAGDLEDSKLNLWGESSVSSEAEQVSPSVGCARNKHEYPTVLHNLESFRWMLDREWMYYLLSTSVIW